MSISVNPIDKIQVRDLILSSRGGILTDIESRTLDSCLCLATHLWVGTIDDELACAWGLVPPSLLSDEAYLWLFHTPAVEAHKFIFVRYSQRIVEDMLKLYPRIVGVCAIGASDSIRWLRWLGAKFGDHGRTHIPFIIEAKNG